MESEYRHLRLKLASLKPHYDLPMDLRGLLEQSSYARIDKNPEILERIERLGYDGIKFPLDAQLWPLERKTLSDLHSKDVPIACFTALSCIIDAGPSMSHWQHCDLVEVFIDRHDDSALRAAIDLTTHGKVVFSLVLHAGIKLPDQLYKFFQSLPKIHLYFPYPSEQEKGWSTRKVYKFVENLQKEGLLHKAGPPLSPLHDGRCVHDTKEEYFWEPNLDTTRPGSPKFSVIIPCFNNYQYLKKTLSNLSRQRLSTYDFEILVVDDGSERAQAASFLPWIREFAQNGLQLKYTYSPRLSPRSMGDGRYRAGISRNLGVAQSRGKILCFLDSDILVPDTYLLDTEQKLMKYDVIQCRRYDLSAKASETKELYSQIEFNSDVIYEDKYWDSFHDETTDWSLVPDGWKYTCTHSLSLRAAAFKDCGWLLPCFIFYGFEDTELGYRLWNNKMKFHLSETKVYHLYHKPERSEFLREKWKRDRILSKTAEIFFRHQPTPGIYQIFEGFLR